MTWSRERQSAGRGAPSDPRRIDGEASHPEGFDTNLQRTVRENANTLGFATASFEDE